MQSGISLAGKGQTVASRGGCRQRRVDNRLLGMHLIEASPAGTINLPGSKIAGKSLNHRLAGQKTEMTRVDISGPGHDTVNGGQSSGTAPKQRTADRMRIGPVLGDYVGQGVLPHVAHADSLADVHVPI
jgi:hypothetical protein